MGAGSWGLVGLGRLDVGVEGVVMALLSAREKKAAVAAAPVAAETPAMIANVVLDML